MSFPGIKRLGIDFTATHETQQHELGMVAWSNTGQQYRYVLAAEAIAVYSPVDYTVAFSASVVDADDVIFGVAQTAIADTDYGWVLEKGAGTVLATGSLSAGRLSNVSAAGAVASVAIVDDADAGNTIWAISYADEASTPAGVACKII